MTLEKIDQAASLVEQRRKSLTEAERKLGDTVSRFLMMHPGTIREIAAKIKVSGPYVHDLIHGRRKPSRNIIEKIRGLK